MASLYTSADPLISLLHDDDLEIQEHALDLIDQHLGQFWSQFSNEVDFIAALTKSHPQLESRAALVLSKLYYHLGDLDVALEWSLLSQRLLKQFETAPAMAIAGSPCMDDAADVALSFDEEYEQAMIAKCIEVYITFQRADYLYNVSQSSAGRFDEDFSIDINTPQHHLMATPLLGASTFEQPTPIDPRIADLLEALINSSIQSQEYSSALGLAVDSLRLDWIKHILITIPSNEAATLMKMAFKISINIVDIHSFQQELLKLLVELYQTAPTTPTSTPLLSPSAATDATDEFQLRPSNATKLHIVSDILALCQCFLALDDADSTAAVLIDLLESSTPSDHALAYQVAFDLMQGQQISFTSRVAAIIFPYEQRKKYDTAGVKTAKVTAQTATAGHTQLNRSNLTSISGPGSQNLLPTVQPNDLSPDTTQLTTSKPDIKEDILTSTSDPAPAASTTTITDHSRLHIYNILTGVSPAVINSHFLYNNAQSQDDWFKSLSATSTQSDPATDSQLFVGYSIAQCGTHRDAYLRTKWSEFEKFTEWAQFSAKASVGNFYKGQAGSIRQILQPFLPSTTPGKVIGADERGSFAQGGSLYALGLASCGMDNNHSEYISKVLQNGKLAEDEPLQAGAALALGLSSIGCGIQKMSLFEDLREVLWSEQPIAGLCSGIAIGLLYTGQYENEEVRSIIKEIMASAIACQHRNSQLGQGLALALIHLNAQEAADPIINYLRFSKIATPFTRWAACWLDAMAYCGTGNERVIQRLLHYGTSDPDHDVKRTAIISLAFVLLNAPEKLVDICEPLSTSYNEHIRFGVALALGIGSTSSGVTSGEYYNLTTRTIHILTPLLKDTNEVVRQGAIIGYSIALLQTTSNSRYRAAIDAIEDVVASKKGRVSLVHKVGASLGAGILHAGGMSSSVRLIAPIGNQKRAIAIAGMMLFCNYWHWYPLTNMFSLTLAPTGVIGTYLQPEFTPGAVGATTANNLGLSVPSDLKYVVKTFKQYMQYPQRLSDEVRLPTKKQVVNKLSAGSKKSKKSKDPKDAKDASNNSSGKMDDKSITPSGVAGAPTLNRSSSMQRTFASDLLRTNSSSSTTSTSSTAGSTVAGSPSASSTVLHHTASQIAAQKHKDEKLPIAVINNCTRLLPRHIPSISCPKGQQYQPIKDRLFGIVVLQKLFEKKQPELSPLDAMIQANDPAAKAAADKAEKQDDLAQPPAVPPAGDISQAEPTVPKPFSMNDD